MQAIERIGINDSWVTLVIMIAIAILAVMKLLKPSQLYGYSISFVTSGFFQKRIEEDESFFTPFRLLLFLFSSIIISLFLALSTNIYTQNFITFIGVFFFVVVYIGLRVFIDKALAKILNISSVVNYFLYSKSGYLHTLCMWLLPVIIVYQYTFTNKIFLITSFALLLLFRFFLLLSNNKKLVISKLFYFILYFCTLEIAPLLIVYKTTT